MKMIALRRDKWIGHTLRHESLLHRVVEGKDRRGRPKKEFIQQVEKDMECRTYHKR
jgi:hypothetical protein